MKHRTKRLTILSSKELREVYGVPRLSPEEQDLYFSLDPKEELEIMQLRTLSTKVYFILALGYFKVKQLFFSLEPRDVQKDVRYITQRYFLYAEPPTHFTISKSGRMELHQRILHVVDYQLCSQEMRQTLQDKADHLVTICTKPFFVIKELVNYLEHQHVVLPGYSSMQKIISQALITERTRLEGIMMREFSQERRMILQAFLNAEDGMYALTLFKKEPKDFTFKEISQEIDKLRSLRPLYLLAQDFLPKTEISHENITYYASLVSFYTVYKLKRMKKATAFLYLLCFACMRFQKAVDNLVNTFMYYTLRYQNEAKKVAKDRVYELKVEGNKHLRKAGKVLELFINDTIPEETDFGSVKHMVFKILDQEKIPLVSQLMSSGAFDEEEFEWNYYGNIEARVKKNLRPILKELEFYSQHPHEPLMSAISFLQTSLKAGKNLNRLHTTKFPHKIIRTTFKPYVLETKSVSEDGFLKDTTIINGDKYEFLVYREIRDKLESGDISVRYSMNFRSFEEDLIDHETWQHKDRILEELGICELQHPAENFLKNMKQRLDTAFHEVNTRIATGQNSAINVTGKGEKRTWRLPYKAVEEPLNHPIYRLLEQVNLSEVLYFVDQHCHCMEGFSHILDRYTKTSADAHKIATCLIAFATNIGLTIVSGGSDLTRSELAHTAECFIRPETLKLVNDRLSNEIAKLPMFEQYNIAEGIIHSSSDGQKYGTQFDTIRSRYSPKYFGLGKGISSCTLVANHVPINARIIGANEHESHFIFDLLFNNTSDIIPDRHSTDAHGSNQVNFAILYFYDYMFAPRFPKLHKKAETLFGFKPLNRSQDDLIKPTSAIKEDVIIEEWENIQKILISLGLKSATQATIIRKLSSYKRKNKTKRALWELDNILRTLYILEYIDSLELRRSVQRALNRGEAYNKLRKAVFYAYGGKFRVKTELEQHIWSECCRLVTNAIIYYNTYILSELLHNMQKAKRFEEINLLKKVSPIAWQHINLYGKYEFPTDNSSIDIQEIMKNLESEDVWAQLLKTAVK